MTELATLSLARAGLPQFPGVTVPAQLLAGRDAALSILRKYIPSLAFDESKAEETLAKVGAWEERNRASLEQVLSDPSAEALPEQIRLSFNSDMARDFVVAGFTQAAAGLGPWMSGAVSRETASGAKIQERWAREDAEYRLQVFGSIVKMEQDGYLKTLFIPPADAGQTSGLGFAPAPVVVWAIVVAVVAVAALVLLYLYSSQRLSENNRLMRDLCEDAQKKGEKDTVASCIEATRGLQAGSMIPGVDILSSGLVKVALLGAALWMAFTLVPPLLEKRRQGKAEEAL